jgi:hypothetical protein
VGAWQPVARGEIQWAIGTATSTQQGVITAAQAGDGKMRALMSTVVPKLPANPVISHTGSILQPLDQLNPPNAPPEAQQTARSLLTYVQHLAPDTLIQSGCADLIPVEGFDATTVAIEAVAPESGPNVWGFLTGAGWFETGTTASPFIQAAFWIAAFRAVSLYPEGMNPTMLCRDHSLIRLIISGLEGKRINNVPVWLDLKLHRFMRLAGERRRTTVIAAGTNELSSQARRLVREVARGRRRPTLPSKT